MFQLLLGCRSLVTIMRANRFLSSCNSRIWPLLDTLIFFPMVFQVWSFLFFIGDQRLISPDWMRSFTNFSNRFWPISHCSKRSSFTLLGVTTFVTRLKRSLLCSMNGFVKFSSVVTNFSRFFSSREVKKNMSLFNQILWLCFDSLTTSEDPLLF